MGDGLLERLGDAVGAEHVLTDPATTAASTTDWTGRWSAPAAAVVHPRTVAEVQAVVRAVAASGAALVTQGGNTGLVGGSVPRRSLDRAQVVVSTRRLDAVVSVDRDARELVVGAGAALADVQRAAASVGLRYAVDLAARDSATIGGTVATNAGGLHVLGLGDTRRQLLGVEAVLADGAVVSRLVGPRSDSSGYDLGQLLCASEGTLGVITAVRLALLPLPATAPTTALVGVPDVRAALDLLRLPGLVAAELLLDEGLELVRRVADLSRPLARDWPVYVLLESESPTALDDLAQIQGYDGRDPDVAVDRRLWAYRERMTEAVATLGVVHKLDVALPVSKVPDVVAALPALVAPHTVHTFGHVGVGNLHVNVVGPDPDDTSVDEAVLRLVSSYGGSISAEHGVGVAKAGWLSMSRTTEEVATMRRVKHALDPDGLLNPGVLFA